MSTRLLLYACLLSTIVHIVHARGATECPPRSSGAERFGQKEFFSGTAFGTLGFEIDGSKEVFVVKPDINCITILRPGRSLSVIFNHRNSAESGVGYISFKSYGLTRSPPFIFARLLRRTGKWLRNSTPLADDPWRPEPVEGRDPTVVKSFEEYYEPGHDVDISVFDKEFGQFHGTPVQSQENSWSDLQAMQPIPDVRDPQHVGYVRQDLERVEITTGATKTENAPGITWDRLQYSGLIVAMHTPLNGGLERTIRFNFR